MLEAVQEVWRRVIVPYLSRFHSSKVVVRVEIPSDGTWRLRRSSIVVPGGLPWVLCTYDIWSQSCACNQPSSEYPSFYYRNRYVLRSLTRTICLCKHLERARLPLAIASTPSSGQTLQY
jgi:hypothetical protein